MRRESSTVARLAGELPGQQLPGQLLTGMIGTARGCCAGGLAEGAGPLAAP